MLANYATGGIIFTKLGQEAGFFIIHFIALALFSEGGCQNGELGTRSD